MDIHLETRHVDCVALFFLRAIGLQKMSKETEIPKKKETIKRNKSLCRYIHIYIYMTTCTYLNMYLFMYIYIKKRPSRKEKYI